MLTVFLRSACELIHSRYQIDFSSRLLSISFILLNRILQPQLGEILYHYCKGQSFAAICTSRKFRLSDLFSMNDFMELHWGYHIWELAAGEMLKDVGKPFVAEIDNIIHGSGFALSTILSVRKSRRAREHRVWAMLRIRYESNSPAMNVMMKLI